MFLVWIVYLCEIILLKFFPVHSNKEAFFVSFILLNTILIFFLTFKKVSSKFSLIIFLAYAIRLFAMFWDLYARHIYILPHSGGDTEGFYNTAIYISENLSLLKKSVYGGLYTKILGFVFNIVGPVRIVGQYINVLLGFSTISLVYKILMRLDLKERTILTSLLILSFSPIDVILFGILLRESFIIFFATFSFFWFAEWLKKPLYKYIFFSLLSLLVASTFHSGVIGIIVGYMFVYLFYSPKNKKIIITPYSLVVFIMFVSVGIFIYTKFNYLIMNKFNRLDEFSDLYQIASGRRGGSAYLTSVRINSLPQLILYTPLYLFYFIASPLPFYWRGLSDILSFLLDGTIFMYLIFSIFRNYVNLRKKDAILFGILSSIIITLIIFSIGVQNAGTAMRHRHKIFPIIVIGYVYIHNLVTTKKS